MRRLAAGLALVLSATTPAPAAVQDRMLDDFADASAWTLIASDDVQASLRPIDGERGKALCVDFDFGRVTG